MDRMQIDRKAFVTFLRKCGIFDENVSLTLQNICENFPYENLKYSVLL